MDSLTPEERSIRMGRIRGRDTKPEMTVRRLLHGMGYRYRLHGKNLPGKPDIVFGKPRKAIFIHGCFWHRHSDPACRLARLPKSRLEFWEPKFAATVARDARVGADLEALGWKVLIVWECELGKTEQLGNKLQKFVEET
jgi:DNA mismatch endonuclease (patch repair protein)